MSSRRDEKAVADLAGCFTDPIICHPGGWGDTLPDWIKHAVTLERLIAMKQGIDTGTDAEVVAYLYTAGFVAPLDRDFSEIFFYVITQTMERWKNLPGCAGMMPADLAVRELSRYQLGELADLKRKIYNRRIRARKEVNHRAIPQRTGDHGPERPVRRKKDRADKNDPRPEPGTARRKRDLRNG